MNERTTRQLFRNRFLIAGLLAAVLAGVVAATLYFAGVFDEHDDDEPQQVEREGPADEEQETLAAGDLVEIITPGGCAPREALGEGQLRPLAAPCAGDGSVFEIVEGPRDEPTGPTWLLSGFGWVGEDLLESIEGDPRARVGLEQLIAFIDVEKDLYVMNADGSDRRMLAEGPVEIYSWSPDGQTIAFGTHAQAFIEDERMVVVDLDGEIQYEVEGINSFTPMVWSPDGTMIAANTVAQESRGGLVVVRAADGQPVFTLPDAEFSSWSADSRRIAFRRFDTSQPLAAIDYPAIGAYADLAMGAMADLAAGGPTYSDSLLGLPLFRPGHPNEIAYGGALINLGSGGRLPLPDPVVKWSPDGRFAVLALQRPDTFLGHHYLLYEIAPVSEDLRFNLYISLPSCQCDAAPWALLDQTLFSRDGSYFLTTNSDDFFTPQRQIVTLDRSEEQPRLPTFGIAHQFSADGDYVLVGAGGNTPEEGWIFLMPIREERLIAIGEGTAPGWQPLADQSTELKAVEEELLRGALRFSELEIEPGFLDECTGDADVDFIACARYLGMSGEQKGYEVLAVPGDCPFGIYFVRPEGQGWVIDHVEPPFCNCAIPCNLGSGAVVEIVVEETCANVRSAPAIAAEINECLPAGDRAEVTGEPVNADARVWVELEAGWVSASFVECVENCG